MRRPSRVCACVRVSLALVSSFFFYVSRHFIREKKARDGGGRAAWGAVLLSESTAWKLRECTRGGGAPQRLVVCGQAEGV